MKSLEAKPTSTSYQARQRGQILNDRIDGFKSALVPGLEVTSIDYGEGGMKDPLPKLEHVWRQIQTSMPSSPPWPTVASPSCQCTLPTQIALTILLWWCLTTRTRHWTAFDKGVIAATTVQRQYNWGFGSVYMLNRLWNEGLELPDNTHTGTLMVTKDNVETYAEDAKNPQLFLDMEGKT